MAALRRYEAERLPENKRIIERARHLGAYLQATQSAEDAPGRRGIVFPKRCSPRPPSSISWIEGSAGSAPTACAARTRGKRGEPCSLREAVHGSERSRPPHAFASVIGIGPVTFATHVRNLLLVS